jgi:PAS domain S-box-containing protein
MLSLLYVDDEPQLLVLGKRFLEKQGQFSVHTLKSAREALSYLEEHQVHAIISDYQMPEMDGIELLKALRARGDKTPFIIFTGKGREEVVIQAINSGADFYLQKGGDPGAQFAELSHKIMQAASRRRAEDSLNKSEEKYRHLIEHSDEAIVVVQDGMLKLVNHRTVEFTGYSEEELLSMSIFTFIHPDDRATVMERYQRRVKGEESPSHYAFRLGLKDRSTRRVEINISAIDWDGRPATLNFLTDITDRKRSEEALNESERRFRELSDMLPQIVYEADANGILTYANRIAFEQFGYTEDDFKQGLNVLQILAPHDRERGTAAFHAMLEGKGKIGIPDEYQVLRKDGGTFPVSIYSSPVILQGRTVGLRGIIIDITERKIAVQNLLNAPHEYQNLLDQIQDVYYRSDPDGNLIIASRSWATLLGYDSIEECIGKPIAQGFYADPEERKPLLEAIRRDGSVTEYEVTLRRKDGSHVVVSTSSHFYYDDTGTILGVEGTFRDITERKRAEERLIESEERHRIILDEFSDPIFSFYPDGTYRHVNRAFATGVGKSIDQIIGRKIWDVFEKDEAEKRFSVLRTVFSTGEGTEIEVRIQRPDGDRCYVTTIVPVKDKSGSVVSAICSSKEITERKRVEDSLRKSEAHLTTAMDIANLVDWEFDVKTGTFFFNDRFYTLYGTTAEREGGYTMPAEVYVNELVYPGDIPYVTRVIGDVASVTDPNYSLQLEHRIIRRDGQIRNIVVRFGVIMDSFGKLIKTYGANQDITYRKRMEEELQLQSRLRHLLMEISSNFISLPLEAVETAVQVSLGDMAKFVGADRAYIFEYNFYKQICTNTHEWCAEGIDPQINELNAVPLVTIPEWVKVHCQGEPIYVPDVLSLPPGTLRDLLEPQGIRSLLAIPMMSKNDCIGFVGFDSVQQHYVYSDNEQHLLTVFAQMLVNVLHRKQSEENLVIALKRTRNQQEALAMISLSPHLFSGDVDGFSTRLTEESSGVLSVERASVWLFDNNGDELRCIDLYEASNNRHSRDLILMRHEYMNEFDALSTAKFIDAHDPLTDPRTSGYVEGYLKPNRITSMLDAVIRVSGQNLGVLCFEHVDRPHHWESDEVAFACQLADQIAITLLNRDRKRAEEALRERSSQIKALIDNLPFDTWAMDSKGQYILQNPESIERWGDFVGKSPHSIPVPAEMREHWLENNRKVLSGTPVRGELSVSFEDGVRIYDEIISPIRLGDEISGIIGVNIDITDRKRVEEALQESERSLKDIIDFLPDATFVINKDGHVIAWNRAIEQMTGVSKEDILGKGDCAYAVPFYGENIPILIDSLISDGNEINPRYNNVRSESGTITAEVFVPSMRNGDGAYIWAAASRLNNRKGEFIGAIESIRDVTDKQHAESALLVSEERYRSVVEDQTEFICRFLPDGNHIFVNDAYCRYFDKKREEIIGHRFRPVLHPKDREIVARHIASITPEHPVMDIDQRIIMPDGSVCWQRWSDRAIFDPDGRVVEYQSVGRDITQQKELEAEMEYHEQELRKFSTSLATANKKLTLLSSITRHDINNQLTVLMGYLSILEQKQPDPTLNEYFGKVSTAAKRISSMIQFTKEYEKIGVHAPAWQGCRKLVDTAAKQAPLGKVMVTNDLPAGIEVLADPLIVKVFYNLMDNAVRYGGKITTLRFSALESGDHHLIVCEDDGDGVVAEEKKKIFERGFGKNTGLGLALSREILSITGITIHENGEPGKGARFEIRVPERAYRYTGDRLPL